MLKRLGLAPVTPHSARHSFISVLQAQGVEVGLVAKLAGHKNAVVMLSHYTHAMRGGEDAVKGARPGLRGERVMSGGARPKQIGASDLSTKDLSQRWYPVPDLEPATPSNEIVRKTVCPCKQRARAA
jgi:Phage integrase family